ncbi:cbb3-type cytochrome c oxidase subunit III [Fluviicoccus keumensis]|uniref:Cbb3-type cytochrome c oxidase subunit III n=1 Tax=Fluviicoccus keumensis TaxID=1435465 RepID=A0A4Q7YM55_9GAMM|nr:c-type cytochrome [Fluviicoccus keumensis]RZU38398.1 cbb3-type cytochrome c oxidase subunit III [Fluviicoccus keumensis]
MSMSRVFRTAVLTGLLLASASGFAAPPELEAKYGKSCATCHGSGVLNAPRKGDREAWGPRLKQGMPVLVGHVKAGFRNMPAKGLCNDCTDADYEALIQFMSQ